MAEAQTNTAVERTKELTDRLEVGIQDLLQSDKYMEYLKSMSQFHHYSTRNTLLIHIQNPNATRVASFKLWEEKFNRHVKKGEKSIRIFAPISPPPEKKLMEKLDPDTGAPMLDTDGKPIMEEMTALSRPRFKLVPVFDKSQTYGEPLPEIVENLTGNVEQYEAFLDSLREVSPLPIEFEPLAENNDGYCRYGEKIGIREGMSEVQTVSAVVHEITHARLHDKNAVTETPDNGEAADPKTNRMKEVEAESVSYVVCQHFGIETSPNSFGYLAEWGSDDMKEFKASLDIIRKESNALITVLDERFKAICKERGIDLSAKEPEQAIPEAVTAEQSAEPSFTTETRTENISGVEFPVTDVVRENQTVLPEKPAPRYVVVAEGDGLFIQDTETGQYYSENALVVWFTEAEAAQRQADELNSTTVELAQEQPAPSRYSELQQRGFEIAQKYEKLPMQDRINIIAETFGCKTGSISTSPCWGKWRGTSDISLNLDNGASLGIGNYLTPRAKTAKVQNECINSTLAQYNPEIVSEIKARATAALTLREAEDNAIAAQKGLKPYTFLNVELNDGSDNASGGYLGWYYVTLAVDNNIFAFTETGLYHDIASGVVGEKPNERAYFVAGALKESDVDFVFNNVAFSSKSSLYHLHLSDSARERAEQTLAGRIAVQEPSGIIPEQSEEDYEITYWLKGTGVDVLHYFNEGSEQYGDYETLARIAPDRSVEFVKTDLSDEIIDKINAYAETADIPNMAADISTNKVPAEVMPDPSIGVAERDSYGYDADDMLPLRQDRALELFDADSTIYMLHPDGTETMVFDREEIENYLDIFGIEREDWQKTAAYAELTAQTGNEKQEEVTATPEQEKPMATPIIQTTLSAMLGLNLADGKAPPPIDEPTTIPQSVYRESIPYAREHDELDKYRDDVKLNTECRDAIHAAINESRYDTHFYKMKDAVKQVVDTYGAERVELIMAKIVQGADWDGRYSRQNKEWAKGFEIPQSMKDIYSNTHPILLDGFLNKVREKPSVLEALKANAEKSRHQSEPKQDDKKSKEMEM